MTPDQQLLDHADQDRRSRRLLLAGSGAALAAGLAAVPAPALAKPKKNKLPKPAWSLTGSKNVSSTGKHFLGPLNVAPLILKTRAPGTSQSVERMRIAPTGLVGIGTPAPATRLDVLATGQVAVRGRTQDSSTSARGVVGQATQGYGVHGITGAGHGLHGEATTGTGVHGVATDGYGVHGESGTYGVHGSGGSGGVLGSSPGGDGVSGSGVRGVYGSGSTGVYGTGSVGVQGVSTTAAVVGTNSGGSGTGVSGSGGQYAVRGTGGATGGVRGDSGYVGVWGEATTYGVYGTATGTSGQNYGIFGSTQSADGYAGFFQGRAHVNGTLSKSAGSFRIDHPLDPENQWLFHSFVESPEMLNIYDGVVTLGADGTATVGLPSYFTALNRDYRYQLTCIGAHAPVYVARKVDDDGTFAIAGGTRGLEVSWQVTGVRQDDYANDHRIVPEVPKPAAERGARSYVARGSGETALRRSPSAVSRDEPGRR